MIGCFYVEFFDGDFVWLLVGVFSVVVIVGYILVLGFVYFESVIVGDVYVIVEINIVDFFLMGWFKVKGNYCIFGNIVW